MRLLPEALKGSRSRAVNLERPALREAGPGCCPPRQDTCRALSHDRLCHVRERRRDGKPGNQCQAGQAIPLHKTSPQDRFRFGAEYTWQYTSNRGDPDLNPRLHVAITAAKAVIIGQVRISHRRKKSSRTIPACVRMVLNVEAFRVEWFGILRKSDPPLRFGRLIAMCSASRTTSSPSCGTPRSPWTWEHRRGTWTSGGNRSFRDERLDWGRIIR